jgi:hypothetical protein
MIHAHIDLVMSLTRKRIGRLPHQQVVGGDLATLCARPADLIADRVAVAQKQHGGN